MAAQGIRVPFGVIIHSGYEQFLIPRERGETVETVDEFEGLLMLLQELRPKLPLGLRAFLKSPDSMETKRSAPPAHRLSSDRCFDCIPSRRGLDGSVSPSVKRSSQILFTMDQMPRSRT
jgi:hypothetical protein